MQFFIKLLISVSIIVLCTQIGRKFPTLGGLIATMPLTSAIVLVWLYSDNPGNFRLMEGYTKGALWGIGPSLHLFQKAPSAFRCLSRKLRSVADRGIHPPVAAKVVVFGGRDDARNLDKIGD